MKNFNYYAPTEIVFGNGCIDEVGKYVCEYGKKALLVTVKGSLYLSVLVERVRNSLSENNVDMIHFDGVIPNPTTDVVSKGAIIAKENNVDVVIGLGGGSSLDVAKAIAVEATHEGTAWDYLHYTGGPTKQTLPIIEIGTTAGTGSQTTPCAVITKTENKDKSAIWHRNIFPKVAIVDPEITKSLPAAITAQTGFDAFCHNFEAYISNNSNPLSDCMAVDAIKLIIKYLPDVIENGDDMEARSNLAYADTLGGLTNASAGVTLPHGLGMQVGGHCPQVTHGQALAAIYPEFMRYTYKWKIDKFAVLGRILNEELRTVSDEEAARLSCEELDKFLKKIDLWIGFKDLDVSIDDIKEIAKCGQVLGDYKNNPRVANLEEMLELLKNSYERK